MISKRDKNTAGYTLLETLTALFIISLVFTSIAGGASIILRRLDAYKQQIQQNFEVYGLMRTLDTSFEDITIPYWERPQIDISAGSHNVKLTYAKQKEDQNQSTVDLNLAYIDEKIMITRKYSEGEIVLFTTASVENCTFDILDNELTGLPMGVSISCTINNNEYEITRYFPARTVIVKGAE